jgi:hypothetical protein|tara:strand:+ start:474 stop:845 length:372 start_codon:yes stop_codon:yes gene_type:complete
VKIQLDTIAGKRALFIAAECVKLLDEKQKDYGPRNISRFGAKGLSVRLYDKVERLANLLLDRGELPKNESLEDTFKDIANYGLIGLMLLRNEWPSEEQLEFDTFFGVIEPETKIEVTTEKDNV